MHLLPLPNGRGSVSRIKYIRSRDRKGAVKGAGDSSASLSPLTNPSATSQPRRGHRFPNLAISHEPLPDVAATQILRRQQRNADVEPQHIRRKPPVHRLERIRESVFTV